MTDMKYFTTLPSVEDTDRYTAPPEREDQQWPEPEDDADFYDEEDAADECQC